MRTSLKRRPLALRLATSITYEIAASFPPDEGIWLGKCIFSMH